MSLRDKSFNAEIWNIIKNNHNTKNFVRKLFLDMTAVNQMLNYIYKVERTNKINKQNIYEGFFESNDVKLYCEREGINTPTIEGSKHRCPFLLNILESIGLISSLTREITVNTFLICNYTMDIDLNDKTPDNIENKKKYFMGLFV